MPRGPGLWRPELGPERSEGATRDPDMLHSRCRGVFTKYALQLVSPNAGAHAPVEEMRLAERRVRHPPTAASRCPGGGNGEKL